MGHDAGYYCPSVHIGALACLVLPEHIGTKVTRPTAADKPVDLVALVQHEPGQIAALLSGNACH